MAAKHGLAAINIFTLASLTTHFAWVLISYVLYSSARGAPIFFFYTFIDLFTPSIFM